MITGPSQKFNVIGVSLNQTRNLARIRQGVCLLNDLMHRDADFIVSPGKLARVQPDSCRPGPFPTYIYPSCPEESKEINHLESGFALAQLCVNIHTSKLENY